ncbi:MAG: LuxR family transcriptional regulator [Deltaproteobacteria bacterium SG8_13]|nr:MAG: LuxR family transcriptional regulator [Deltaproteobacteria bacterium SG8_13]
MTYRIVLADDHKIIRDGLKALLEKEREMEIVAEAENGRQALQLVRKHNPDIVIMDISMPDLNGIDATRQITSEQPSVKVIALSMHSQRQFVDGMLRAGVSAYLLKDTAFEELVKAVRIVLSGKKYLSPDVTDIVFQDYRQPPVFDAAEQTAELTQREREVLQLIAEGRATKEIASRLHISVKTVETHRKHIMEKLDLHTVAELTKYAIREGITSLE